MPLFSFLITHEIFHIALYTFFAILIGLRLNKFFMPNFFSKKNLKYYFIGLAVTILLDIDHLIDYFIYKKAFQFNFYEFLSGTYFDVSNKFYVFFHGWEYALLVLLASFLTKNKKLKITLLFVFIGIFSHLLVDSLAYSLTWDGYIFLKRAFYGFSVSRFE